VETLLVLADNYAAHTEAARAAGLEAHDTVPIMRTVFVSGSAREGRNLRERLAREAARAGRRPGALEPAAVEDWCIIGEAGFVRDRIAEYRERLRVTHLIVARPRVAGVEERALRASLETLPTLITDHDRREHA
jgi:alkanesulfonate monooxygenase SsuD/methylene tetrahydromethanopterin reductase-like flavin-dependent oxidoreductase (luciferase family)